LRGIIEEKLPTKQSIKDLKTEMKELENRLTFRLGDIDGSLCCPGGGFGWAAMVAVFRMSGSGTSSVQAAYRR
jgi:hypothetical protein